MIKLLKSELYRLFHRKSIYLIFIFSLILVGIITKLFSIKLFSGINYRTSKWAIMIFADRFNNPQGMICNRCIEIVFIIIPFITNTIIGEERDLGSLRMILLRPYKKGQIILSKLITLIIIDFLYLSTIFISSYIFSMFMMPTISYTKLLFNSSNISFWESFIFNIRVYLIYLVEIILISYIFSIVGTFIKNTVLAFIVQIAILVSTSYLVTSFRYYIISPLNYIYDILSKHKSPTIIIFECLSIIIIGMFLKLIWNRFDYVD